MISELRPTSPEMDKADARDREPTIPVSEIFGPTLEGEGPWAGTPTYFLRVGGCDYGCLWCDTDQAVLAENVRKLPRRTQNEIWDQLYAYSVEHPGPDLLAISGGNPGLYDLGLIVDFWQSHDRSANGHDDHQKRVLVETQGSLFKPWMARVNLLTVSPKPPSSGLDPEASLVNLIRFWEKYEQFRGAAVDHEYRLIDHKAIFKMVVFDEDDYLFARNVHTSYPQVPFYLSTGTAMGGLDGKWVPPAIPDLKGNEAYDPDVFQMKRDHPDMQWALPAVDSTVNLLRRYRWLAERAMNDSAMADATVGVQLHCLLWGITTKGV